MVQNLAAGILVEAECLDDEVGQLLSHFQNKLKVLTLDFKTHLVWIAKDYL